MRPVVPRVRVGEVLLGTKNLRNWLHTSALRVYVRRLKGRPTESLENGLPPLAKTDKFVVAVNAWETFGVWNRENEIVLLFVNPPRGRGGFGPVESGAPRMSPDLFARWFIRTKGRQPDLEAWPNYAYHLWAALQMNVYSGGPHRQINYAAMLGVEAPFTLARRNDGNNRAFIREKLEQSIPFGVTRQKTRKRHPSNEVAYGPDLRDLPTMRQEIRNITKNPHMAAKLVNYPEFMLVFGNTK